MLELKDAKQFDRLGTETKIYSMLEDGTQSWMVISRCVGKYVTELSEENNMSIHYDEASSSTGKLVAMEQKRTTKTV